MSLRSIPAVVTLVLALLAPALATGEDVTIVLLHTNDMHGQVRALAGRGKNPSRGGFSRLYAAVRQARREARERGWHLFLVDAGDFYQGTPEGNLSRGRLVVDLMNRVGYDLGTVGNHEFDNGADNLAALAKRAAFPLLTANVRLKATGEPPEYLKATVLRKAGPVTVGFFGITTTMVPLYTFPEHTRGLAFLDPVAAAKGAVGALRGRGAAVVVGLSHVGVADDLRVAKEVEGLDLVVGGHSHTVLKKGLRPEGGGALVVQAGAKALFLGRVDMVVDPATGRVKSMTSRLLSLDGRRVARDEAFAARIGEACKEIDAKMDVEVGRAGETIKRGGYRYSGTSSPLGNLITDLMRAAAKADLAYHNRTGMRDELRKGPVRRRDVYRVQPFGNTVVVLEMTGDEILDMMTYALTYGSRYLLEMSGGTCEYAMEEGRAVILAMTVGGRSIDPQRSYRVATTNFIASGGDGHKTFKKGRNHVDTGILLRELIVRHLEKRSPVRGVHEKRIVRWRK